MKEININIEGYNVNGICVACLNYNRCMFYLDEVKDCFKILANIDVPDGLTIQVCWECLAYVKNTLKFRKQILKCYDILIAYSEKHTFLNSPNDLASHAIQRLTSDVQVDDIAPKDEPSVDVEIVKNEPLVEDDRKFIELDLQTDTQTDIKLETEDYNDDIYCTYDEPPKDQADFYEDLSVKDQTESDDDITLAKLKNEKGSKKKKKKDREKKEKEKKRDSDKTSEAKERKSRRLKNLPEKLVELYTMSEKEMWEVRAKDVQNETFQKVKYKCEMCIYVFNTKKLMELHVNGKHHSKSDDDHQCDVCKAYFLTKENIRMHRKLHEAAYKCRECNLVTTLKKIMLEHECAKKLAEPGYPCPDCPDKVFSTKSKLSYHRSVTHQEKPQCDCCGKVFANKITLKYHLKILPQNKEEKPKEKLFIPCKGCGKIFHSKKSYRAHVVIHDGLTYPCPICGKMFQWKRNLARHTRNHREREAGALHRCRECGKSFASRDCYNNHMRLSKRHAHEGSYTHTCHFCGKKFATRWCMMDHIDWDHLRRIKYQCSVCFKAFKTAKIMVAHMNNIHEGKNKKEPDGQHLCDICGKSYKTVKRLKGHVWAMHTNRSVTKSFKCSLCPATFSWQTSIYKHMKMMHYNKRAKQPRAPVKKPEVYPGIEVANRMPYYPPIATNLQTAPLINLPQNV
ncbi:zinc finger protein 254-like [Melitaea cinxia]|uniref:zinc finger protein 254-like n=1 Tax=Melitaea cinxia TaxID=113334 RepID=UPI001E26F84D|nr:zinc finger protein 254-like [Melitaea cinxia]